MKNLSYIYVLLTQVITQITFQKGSSSLFYYLGNNLNLYNSDTAGRSLSITYNFPQSFQRVPQVYLNINVHDYWKSFPVGYSLYIDQITVTSFTVTIAVPHTNRFYGIVFDWYAFDDLRRIVISAFNQTTIQGTYSFSLSNPNFSQAVANIVSFVYNSYMSCRVFVFYMSSVVVGIDIRSNGNIAQLGFQVLVGTPVALSVGTGIQLSGTGGSALVQIPSEFSGAEYATVIEGMGWDAVYNFRIRTFATIVNSNVNFTAESWAESYFTLLYMNYFFTLGQWDPGYYLPMYCIDYFQQKLLDENNSITNKLSISQLSANLVPTTTKTYNMNTNTLEITVEIFAKCTSNELWSLKLLKCQNSYETYDIQCDLNKKFLSHRHTTQFKQLKSVYQKITVSVTNTLISISQNVIDYYKQDFVLLELKKN